MLQGAYHMNDSHVASAPGRPARRGQNLFFALVFLSGVAPVKAQTTGGDEGLKFLEEERQAVVVSSTLRPQKTTDAPSSVTVVTADDIKKKGYRTIKDIMLDV